MNNTEEKKKEKKSIWHILDDGLLMYSSSKLGLTDYDKNETYDREERKATWKDVALIIGITGIAIAVAAVLVLFVLT